MANNQGLAVPSYLKKAQEAKMKGIASGNINISSADAETMELAKSSKESLKRQQELINTVEAKRRARTLIVPTNDKLVRKKLRQLGEPITLFGERAPDRRERLREIMAAKAVAGELPEQKSSGASALPAKPTIIEIGKERVSEGPKALRATRLSIAKFSLPRAKERIASSKRKRQLEREQDDTVREKKWTSLFSRIRRFQNTASEIGDQRPLSACHFAPDSRMVSIGSWSGKCSIWGIPSSRKLAVLAGHKNRVSDIMFHPEATQGRDHKLVNVATCGVDRQALLWAMPESSTTSNGVADMDVDTPSSSASSSSSATKAKGPPTLRPLAELKGHEDRLCRLAFHPMGKHLITTSFDETWRFWDLTTQKCLLTQTGHSRGVYAVACQNDGSLVCTGDIGGNAIVWDLRTGKSIFPLLGHVKQVLCADFAPNGWEVATGSDDHTVKVWDLRRRKTKYTIPAHSNLISSVRYDRNYGDYLLTSSYDMTCKIWRGFGDFVHIKTLAGHQSRVMRADLSPDGQYIVSVSFDRTWKLWTQEDPL